MRFLFTTISYLLLTSLLCIHAAQEDQPTVYIDKEGTMRWSDTKQEASFFGVNYTLPFAHAYRALNYLGKDHKEAIDKDVYHFARLGFNAYRIHIWDVEISDENGNLIENNHLDLLDYLIARLKERNIKIVMTTMTSFGNGYPEKDENTGGFSYLYNKCNIHDNPEAIRAQQNYISALVKHVNPYTGKSYRNDPDIIGFEVNNEPCHAGTQAQTRSYIQKMVQAIRKTGCKKPIFYNVSHNMQQLEAYYNSPIQGTTYQWYPIGLVAGHTRQGNFLPYVENYPIPFNQLNGFSNKTKLIYEFDPADIIYSYMYPAMARSFRTAGFQWITQFSYDPIDIAWANTEYQTHFLNLAYTPQKAISMKIATEVVLNTPLYSTFDPYPKDTIFGNFRVSYKEDLSEMNTPEKFFYSNNTSTHPVNPETLQAVCGYGNSPIIRYQGTGAYFLDKLEEGIWRLEIMPDAIQIKDPFERPSLKKEVVTIAWGEWNMEISLPDLGNKFEITGLNKENNYKSAVKNSIIQNIRPGVYLLKKTNINPTNNWQADTSWKNIRLGEYVAPYAHSSTYEVNHQPPLITEAGKPLWIQATIAGPSKPDSVIIYTDKVSFWKENNPYTVMKQEQGYTYSAILPAENSSGGTLNYNIVICKDGKQYTFPEGIENGPLDWDYTGTKYYHTLVVSPTSSLTLFDPNSENSKISTYIIPESRGIKKEVVEKQPTDPTLLRFTFESAKEEPQFFLRSFIKDKIKNRPERLSEANYICLHTGTIPAGLQIGFITSDGYTYKTTIPETENSITKIPVRDLKQASTALLPHAYPDFLEKYFVPVIPIPFDKKNIEQLELSFPGKSGEKYEIEIGNIWME